MRIRKSNMPNPTQKPDFPFDNTKSKTPPKYVPQVSKTAKPKKLPQKNIRPSDLSDCVHNKGANGVKVGYGCNRRDQYVCDLHQLCILSKCTSSSGLKVCKECSDFTLMEKKNDDNIPDSGTN